MFWAGRWSRAGFEPYEQMESFNCLGNSWEVLEHSQELFACEKEMKGNGEDGNPRKKK